MKYVIVLCDGMSDYDLPQLGDKTPLEVAHTPCMDSLAGYSELGLARSVPLGMKPGSDTANLSILGYDPSIYYSGRSPLEALAMGVHLKSTDIAIRCNLVSLSEGGEYDSKTMLDYSAGEISTQEAKVLINYLAQKLGKADKHLYSGVSYRHCLVLNNAKLGTEYTPPHDITGKQITQFLPKGRYGEMLARLQRESYTLLNEHPINQKRAKSGKAKANSIWLWGEGVKPSLRDFHEKNGVKGAMISAVDLLKGIAYGANMKVVEVSGANGMLDTNYKGKAKAAIEVLKELDFVYIHIEAPDEMSHQGLLDKKILAIENIDREIICRLYEGLKVYGEYSILVCPDHATPLSTRTHSDDPIPYMLYRSNNPKNNHTKYNEKECAKSNIFISQGHKLIDRLLKEVKNG